MLKFLMGRSAATKAATHMPPLVEQLERRQLLSVTINPAKIKVRNITDETTGFSTNQSQLTVPFTEEIQIVDASKIRMIGYVQNPVGGAQRKVVVKLSEIERIEEAPNHIRFKTDRLSPRSGRVIIDPGAIRAVGNNQDIGAHNVQPPKGQNKERFTLATRAFRATDVSIYSQAVHPSSPPVGNLTSNLTYNQVTPLLDSFLQKKVANGTITAAQKNAAMAQYNDANVQLIFPNHNLRAALVSLVGTVGEPAINVYLTDQNITGRPFTVVDFSAEVSPSAVVAETKAKDGRLRTLFKTQYRGEPFQVLSGYLAHEALHQDQNAGQNEEIIANIVETYVYVQQAMAFRGFIFTPSNLTRMGNDKVYAMLNSGTRSFPRVGITNAVLLNNSGVFYQSPTNDSSFEAHIRRLYQERGFGSFDTPGNPALAAMYTKITGKTRNNPAFNQSLINDFDANQTVIGDRDAIRVAGLFGLTFWAA